MTDKTDHEKRLRDHADPAETRYDLSPPDASAVAWAMEEIDRLRTEVARLKGKLAFTRGRWQVAHEAYLMSGHDYPRERAIVIAEAEIARSVRAWDEAAKGGAS